MADSYIARQIAQSEGTKRKRERRGSSSSKKKSEAQVKYEKAVAAGVDPEKASFAFNYVPEGKTRVVTVQSKQGVGVSVTRGGSNDTTRGFERRGESEVGTEYAIPTDDSGRTRTDVLIARNQSQRQNFSPVSRVDPAYAAYPAGYSVTGNTTPRRDTSGVAARRDLNNTKLSNIARGQGAVLYTPRSAEYYSASDPANSRFSSGSNQFSLDYSRLPRGEGRVVRTGLSFTRIPDDLYRDDLTKFENLDLIRRELASQGIREQPPAVAPGSTVSGVGAAAQSLISQTGTLVFGRTPISRLPLAPKLAVGLPAAVSSPGIFSVGGRDRADRDVVNDPVFNSVFQAGLAERDNRGPVRGFVENVPVLGPAINDLRGDSRAFRRGAIRAAREANVEDPERFARVAEREFRNRQAGGLFGQLQLEALSESTGRLLTTQLTRVAKNRAIQKGVGLASVETARSVAVRSTLAIAPAGAIEGAGSVVIDAETNRRTARPRDVLIGAGAGAVVAGTTGGFIAAARKVDFPGGRRLETALNIVDPLEKPGDLLEDAASDGLVFTLTPTRSFTNTNTNVRSRSGFTTSPTNVQVINPEPDFSGLPSVPDATPSFTPSIVPTNTPIPTNTPVPTNTNVPVTIPTQINLLTPVQTPVPTRINTPNLNSQFSFTNINTPVQVFDTPFVFPGGSPKRTNAGFARRRDFGSGVQNLPSLTALTGRLSKVKKLPRSYRSTGIEIRGL